MIGYLIIDKEEEPVPVIGIPYARRHQELVVRISIPYICTWGDVYKVEFDPTKSERRRFSFGWGYCVSECIVLELL